MPRVARSDNQKPSSEYHAWTKVASLIWFVQGEEARRPKDNTDPNIILLFGWMDAKPSHLAKYSAGYRKLYPYSNQIVVGCKADLYLLPKFILNKRLRPAVQLLYSLGATAESSSQLGILAHCLSNGGAGQLNYFSQLVPRDSFSTKKITSAVVLDSTPGGDDLTSSLHVFSTTIPNPLLRFPFIAFLILAHTIMFLLGRVPWKWHNVLRSATLNPNWLPWQSKQTPFLYVYSRKDKTAPFVQVQRQTEIAEGKGQNLTRLVFEESEHVSHMRSDPERYWGTVKTHWERAVSIFRK